MSDQIGAWRQDLGSSTALWAGAGRHEVTEQRWLTLSGCPSTDFNVILCYGDSRGDWGPLLTESLADVQAAKVPSVVMVTGAALGSVQVLIDAKWVCIGEVPLMHLPAAAVPPDPDDKAVRLLTAEDLGAVRTIVSKAFGLPPTSPRTASPPQRPNRDRLPSGAWRSTVGWCRWPRRSELDRRRRSGRSQRPRTSTAGATASGSSLRCIPASGPRASRTSCSMHPAPARRSTGGSGTPSWRTGSNGPTRDGSSDAPERLAR